jgi:hypothetical protein
MECPGYSERVMPRVNAAVVVCPPCVAFPSPMDWQVVLQFFRRARDPANDLWLEGDVMTALINGAKTKATQNPGWSMVQCVNAALADSPLAAKISDAHRPWLLRLVQTKLQAPPKTVCLCGKATCAANQSNQKLYLAAQKVYSKVLADIKSKRLDTTNLAQMKQVVQVEIDDALRHFAVAVTPANQKFVQQLLQKYLGAQYGRTDPALVVRTCCSVFVC